MGMVMKHIAIVFTLSSHPYYHSFHVGLPPHFDIGARGPDFMAYIPTVTWAICEERLRSVINLLKAKGITKIAMMGFCWGGWALLHASIVFPEISVGVVAHPAIHLEQYAYGGDNEALAKQVTIPIFLLPAGNDPEIYSVGGPVYEALKSNNAKSMTTEEYKDQTHGWVPRGHHHTEANVVDKQKLALEQMLAFITSNI
jgi:dienelactone hydrolase